MNPKKDQKGIKKPAIKQLAAFLISFADGMDLVVGAVGTNDDDLGAGDHQGFAVGARPSF